jgi:hypothetical protein
MPKRKAPRARKSTTSAKKRKKPAPRKKSSRAKKSAPRRKPARRRRVVRARGRAGSPGGITLPVRSGFGPGSGGQSGDIEGLPGVADADSESVEELAAEGQDFEAEIVDAVENAPDPDESEVKTREVPQNDVPGEYEDDHGNR